MSKTTKIVADPKTDRRVLIKIHEIFKTTKWDAAKLGRALGYTSQHGGNLMQGKRGISINLLIRIAEILNIPAASLLPGFKEEKNPANLDEYI